MADSEEPRGDVEGADEGPAPTPFDNPFFLPVVLLAFASWFIYDGWFNSDEHMQKWLGFNRWGAGIAVSLGLWFLLRAIRERRAERDGTRS